MDRPHILVTGAFGNIGSFVLEELLSRGHAVTALDKDTRINRRNARRFDRGRMNIRWGDITDRQSIQSALPGVDAVIHLAGIFPPASENHPALARAVNVDGTQYLIETMQASETARRLVFASSIAVYGKRQGRIPPPLNTSHPVSPDDCYGVTKARCEDMIRRSGLDWTILRISACPPVNVWNMASFKSAPFLEMHPDSRVEIIHPADAALALVNAAVRSEAIGRTFLLGGGEGNRMTTLQLFNAMFAALGLRPLPREAFRITEEVEFHGDWLDTEESQAVLQFQRYDCGKMFEDLRASLGPARHGLFALKALSPFIRWLILQTSPYYREQKRQRYEQGRERQ